MLVSLLFLPSLLWADWTVRRQLNAQGMPERCVLESSAVTMSDGYQDTQVLLMLSAEALQLKAKAPLDSSFRDLGLQVDKHDFIPVENLVEDRVALFTAQYPTIVEQMKRAQSPPKKGQKVTSPTIKLQLRFWPTWPARGVQTAELSLEGFSKAYMEFSTCK